MPSASASRASPPDAVAAIPEPEAAAGAWRAFSSASTESPVLCLDEGRVASA